MKGTVWPPSPACGLATICKTLSNIQRVWVRSRPWNVAQWNRCTEANAQRSPSATRSVPFVTTMHNRSGDDPGGATMKLVFQEGCQRGPMPVQHSTSHHTGLMSPVSRMDVWLSTVDAAGNAARDIGPMPARCSTAAAALRWF